jgi:Rieske Fe-S protein
VLSAKSTHLGCTVGWNAQLGASKDIADYDGDGVNDGRILDPCHQGQWDAFHRGEPQPGTPAPARLAGLDVRIVDGHLEGTGFDGPVGPQRYK